MLAPQRMCTRPRTLTSLAKTGAQVAAAVRSLRRTYAEDRRNGQIGRLLVQGRIRETWTDF